MPNTPFDAEVEQLEALGLKFMDALKAKEEGRFDDAEAIFREVLTVEPRLAEPRLELARVLLDTDRLEDAEVHARQALANLQAGGQWNDDIPEKVLLGLAHALLAEILRRLADEDNLIFGDPAKFRAVVKESRELFEEAAQLDPADEYSSYYAFFMGTPGEKPEDQ